MKRPPRKRSSEEGNKPASIADALRAYLSSSKIGDEIDQSEVISVWHEIVGPQIAAVATARAVTRNSMLIVDVDSNAWMNELSLREPEIITAIKQRLPESKITRIRWQLRRD